MTRLSAVNSGKREEPRMRQLSENDVVPLSRGFTASKLGGALSGRRTGSFFFKFCTSGGPFFIGPRWQERWVRIIIMKHLKLEKKKYLAPLLYREKKAAGSLCAGCLHGMESEG
jgi:hypothetical protein